MVRVLPTVLLFLVGLASISLCQEPSEIPIEVTSDSIRNVLIRKVPPVYPPLARQARIQGTVILNVIITKSGEIGDVRLVSGHPLLAPAAIQAVKQWRYKPYKVNGHPVEVATNLRINFSLAGMPAANGVAGDIPGGLGDLQGSTQPGHVRVSREVMQAFVVSKVPPEYPAHAKEQHIEGPVLLQVSIDKEGNVANLQLISGHPLLAPAAIDAVKQWKYRPYLLNGEPIEVETQVLVNFTLSD